ncbi:hypothetical protein C8R44DRAFT_156193 [Mycena epipterygia]|nr:hypothetical protein C8R44DRAFT_156193 [Mycena epipterygia]
MDQLISYSAIFFPSDGRAPSVVQLMTSPTQYGMNAGPRMPHPEAHMDFIAESNGLGGARPWGYILIENLDGMNKKFTNPYIVYYPTVSRDGMPFPVNKSIRDLQGERFDERFAWRGNVIIAKYRDHPFSSMVDASMADFPILKNFIRSRGSPQIQR